MCGGKIPIEGVHHRRSHSIPLTVQANLSFSYWTYFAVNSAIQDNCVSRMCWHLKNDNKVMLSYNISITHTLKVLILAAKMSRSYLPVPNIEKYYHIPQIRAVPSLWVLFRNWIKLWIKIVWLPMWQYEDRWWQQHKIVCDNTSGKKCWYSQHFVYVNVWEWGFIYQYWTRKLDRQI